MTDALKVVGTFGTALEAEVARGRLESEGIQGFIQDGNTVNANWMFSNAIGGVRLAVRSSDFSKAQSILKSGVEISGNDSGWGSCPNCHSRNLEPTIDKRITNFSWLLLGLPLLLPRTRFCCRTCGQQFKTPESDGSK